MNVRPPPVAQPPPPPPVDTDNAGIPEPSAPFSRAESGDEAYLRRAAMTAPTSEPTFAGTAPPPRQPSPPQLAYDPFAPPSVPPPPPGPPGSVMMDERARAAAAIAAKLGAIRPPTDPAPPPVEEERQQKRLV